MSKFISGIFLVAFATAGIVGLLREFWLWLLKADCPDVPAYYIVIPVSGHMENIGGMLGSVSERAKAAGFSKTYIVCADCGMDAETKLLCGKICAGKPETLICCRPEELCSIAGALPRKK